MLIADKNSIKGVSVSLLLHLLIAFAFFYTLESKSVLKEEPPRLISISLSSFELPVVQKPQESEPERVVQKQEVEKVVQKSLEKRVEEIVQNRVVESAAAVQETIIKESTAHLQESINLKETQNMAEFKVEEKKVAPNMELVEKEFAKTNFQSIRDKVLANLKYPHIAKRMGMKGCVEVTLVIDPDGKLLDIVLEKSSGHDILDKSAIKAAGELYTQALPMPQIISRVTLPINFALN
jgi:protein TonB